MLRLAHRAQHSLDERVQLGHYHAPGLQYFFVVGGRDAIQIGLVTNTGNAQNPRATVPGYNSFRHGGHPHRIRAYRLQKAQISRGFEIRPRQGDVYALLQPNARSGGGLNG